MSISCTIWCQVDFFQAYLIELLDEDNQDEEEKREGEDEKRKHNLFCVEHFVEGDYVKYNSNSGFVSDVKRLTPQVRREREREREN